MKKLFNIFALLLMGFAGVVSSCDKEEPFVIQPDSKGSGQVSFRKMLVEVQNEENIVRSATVDVNTFRVTVTNTRTQEPAWAGTYGEMPEVLTLPVGNYEVVVNSDSNPDAEWESPYFEGKQSFVIAEDAITTVDPVVCKLANVKVTVIFDDSLKAVMGQDCKVTVMACDNGRLEYLPSESRSGYFKFIEKAGSTPTMIATFSGTVDENYEENFRTYTAVKPGNHYKITYTLKGVNPNVPEASGTITPGIYVDSQVTTVDMTIDVVVDDDILNDDMRPNEGDKEDPSTPDDPVTPGAETPQITLNPGLSFDSPNTVVPDMEAVIYVHSSHPAGLTGFTVDIESTTLTKDVLEGVELTDHLDLVNPGIYNDKLKGLGFPTYVEGQTDPSPMSLTDFLPMLEALGAGTHKFHLNVTDANGTTKKTLTFITL